MVTLIAEGNVERGPDVLEEAIVQAKQLRPYLDVIVVGPDVYRNVGDAHEKCDAQTTGTMKSREVKDAIRQGATTISVATSRYLDDSQIDGIVYSSATPVLGNELHRRRRKKNLQRVLEQKTGTRIVSDFVYGADIPAFGNDSRSAFTVDVGVTDIRTIETEDYLAHALLAAGMHIARNQNTSARMVFPSKAQEIEKQQNPHLVDAYDILKKSWEKRRVGVEPRGFYELDQIIHGGRDSFDVVATDGYTGNNILKIGKGWLGVMKDHVKDIANESYFTAAGVWMASKSEASEKFLEQLKTFQNQGAYVLGMTMPGTRPFVAVRPHGGSTAAAYTAALVRAHDASQENLIGRANGIANQLMQGL